MTFVPKMIMLRNPNDDTQDKLNKFWISLSAWMNQQEVIEKYFRGDYEYFDIRHNEYLNKAKEKREVLEDLQFIEYLYNRVYALLYLLRLKVKKEDLISGNVEEQENLDKI